MTVDRRARSFMSTARLHTTLRGSMRSVLDRKRWLSSMAARSALAGGDGVEVPGEVEVDLVHGDHLGVPPPAAPPLIPNTGPRLGSRRQSTGFRFRSVRASASPTEMVDFPSPAGVGLIPVTSTSFPGDPDRARITSRGTFALVWP
jgi:hypothetical protein